MSRRNLGAILLLGTALLAGPALAQNRDLTIVSWGGAYQDAQRGVFFRPFQQQSGTRLLEETWDGGVGVLRAKIQSGANNWDLVQVESEELLLGCEEGLFEKMDYEAIGGQDKFIEPAVSECGVGNILYSFVLAYDKGRTANAPASWADFFDTTKFPGKRGLRRGPKTTLETALLADGVAPADVYQVLGTPEGVDRAFRKLDTIKNDIVWWERGSQPPQWLASGEVAMTNAYNGRISAANSGDGRNFGIAWKNNLFTLDSWVIMKGSPNKEQAQAYLKFWSQPQVAATLPPHIPYGTTIKGADALLPASVLTDLPSAPQNAEGALEINDQFWLDNLDTLNQRFNNWVSR
ncbi:ABC transporter substrate-binding protein [Roseomonas marmotae]|uniref:ABC transporter substrate-binding protein n=1 Tax=Roseomonas marmotae TaxID=2768161 RepID=A0ABS3K6F5_9PROT|nr:ABC transporter substrate-binding protein [Roseomonas marmotae]MBO1073035.1 ABC transporter substrate-binding protein [Roseomonas marmotae]QTI79318.1 ABC transporter substrate-binding protein [Roseomonas marmotae]